MTSRRFDSRKPRWGVAFQPGAERSVAPGAEVNIVAAALKGRRWQTRICAARSGLAKERDSSRGYAPLRPRLICGAPLGLLQEGLAW